MNTNVEVAGKTVWLEAMTGRVANEKKWTESHIRSSGGGGLITNGSGFVRPTRITNVNTTRHEFWLVGDNDRELCVELRNSPVQVRPGQVVTVAWGAVQGQKRGPFLLVLNHATGEEHWLQTRNPALRAMGLRWLLSGREVLTAAAVILCGILVSHLLENISFLLVAGSLIFLLMRHLQKKVAVGAAIRKGCLQLSAESAEEERGFLKTRPA